MKLIFDDHTYSFEMLRTISRSVYNGADIGECIKTGYRIIEGDDESWYREWLKTAQFTENLADESLRGGHEVSAREAYLRASNYYRSSEFFIHSDLNDPRINELSSKSRICFQKAGELFQPRFEILEIPYEDTTLPAYFLKCEDSSEPKPTVILQTGFDGTGEELYFGGAAAAVRRGYNCLVFEGPGQGRVLREQKLKFRPDWEAVITPIVNYTLNRDDVDPERIALDGSSFGGYLAPRAVAYEHRIQACIANGGPFDFLEPILNQLFNLKREEVMNLTHDQSEKLDKKIYEVMKKDAQIRWSVQDSMWKFEAETPHECFLKMSEYNLKDHVDKIRCKMLVVDSENEMFFAGQPKKLYDALNSPKKFIMFTAEEGAEEHCQNGASSLSHQKIFDWLDKEFNK